MMDIQASFEQGPIRPPSEARSLLLRLTRNCPWNRCLFCPVYKKRKFSLRTVAEIKEDIETVREMVDHIRSLSRKMGAGGTVEHAVADAIFSDMRYSEQFRGVAAWLHYDTGACFLQDADNLIMKTGDLVEVLRFLREKLPEVSRVTTYARSRTIVRKSLEAMTEIRESGLDRIHIGLETAYDPLLKLMKKGVTAQQHVEAGRRVMDAGMELSEYVMPGLGGQEMWREHAMATAKVLNRINPHFIRLRSLRVPSRVPLYEKLREGSFTPQTDDMIAEEIKLFVETLEGITSTVTSDHIMNLLEEVSGKMPEDKNRMIQAIETYQGLSEIDKMVFRIGRRGGSYGSVNDLKRDPETYGKIRNLLRDIQSREGTDGLEKFITDMVDRYI
jgi:histone acetyltransferase (RNA polymerase elongator complex component)